jgi:hypothetical protein
MSAQGSWPLALIATLTACAARPALESTARPTRLGTPGTERPDERARPRPLELPASRFATAPWLEPGPAVLADPSLAGDPPLLPRAESVFVGRTGALARIGESVFGFSEASGITGPLELPEGTSWAGLDGRGRVLAATNTGELLRAPNLEHARTRTAFVAVAHVPEAIAWDTNGEFVAAATTASVLLSSDGGQSFRRLGHVEGPPIVRVFVRSDGVVAAQADARVESPHATWLASPTRAPRPSHLWPSELERAGDRIAARYPDYPVLSRDGLHWAADESDGSADFETASWVRVLSLSDRPAGLTRDFSPALGRPPPPAPRSGQEPRWVRSTSGSHRTVAPQIVLEHRETVRTRCACAAYLSGLVDPEPTPARHALALFSDGRCDAAHEDAEAQRAEPCALDAPWSRPPTAAVLDRSTGVVTTPRLPPDCQPEALLSTGGIGVVLCAPTPRLPRISLYLLDRSGQSYRELELDVPTAREARSLSRAPDGTLLLRAGWDTSSTLGDPASLRRRAFVRSPLPLGHAEAWREVDVSDATEVRVDLGGGLVLVNVSRTVPCPGSFELELDRPDEPRARLGTRVRVEGTLVDLFIRGRRIYAAVDPTLAGIGCALRHQVPEALTSWVVMGDGSLVETAAR